MTFLVVVVGWVISLCAHEWAHARTAFAGGDVTVREKGYLSFNPLRYADPVVSVVMPLVFLALGGIGLPGGAVYIERRLLRSRRWEAAVSLAGPAANLALAVVIGGVLRLTPVGGSALAPGLAFLGYLQVMAVLFNLIPLPPLDGFGALAAFLRPDLRMRAARAGRWTIWVLFLALWYIRPAYEAFWGLTSLMASLVGIPLDLAGAGLQAFRFW